MAPDNLRDFIQAIEAAGELVRVAHPVHARLEIAEIADRSGGLDSSMTIATTGPSHSPTR
jgi:UbiD family decarboxylase